MKPYRNRALILGKYIALTGATVRQCASHFGISKSTVHSDITKRLPLCDRQLYEKVYAILQYNKSERHIRGGMATKRKYEERNRNTGNTGDGSLCL